jgi:hypothetical protein
MDDRQVVPHQSQMIAGDSTMTEFAAGRSGFQEKVYA